MKAILRTWLGAFGAMCLFFGAVTLAQWWVS